MDYDEHVEAGEQCFGSRFCWPGVACAFANWPCIGKLFFFPNLSLLVAQSSIYIYIYIIMINGSKISVHRFIATTLFRMIEG